MEKKVSQFRQSNLPHQYKPATVLVYLIFAMGSIFLIGYMLRDDIFSTLFFVALGIIVILPAKKWTIQHIEIRLKEGKNLYFADLRATRPGKKSSNRILIFIGVHITIITIMLCLLFPGVYSGDLSAFYEMSPLLMALRTPLPGFSHRMVGVILSYLAGGIIGFYVPVYLWARKLPK